MTFKEKLFSTSLIFDEQNTTRAVQVTKQQRFTLHTLRTHTPTPGSGHKLVPSASNQH